VKQPALKQGDVFAFPASDGMVGCGQVVEMRHGIPLVAIFEPRFLSGVAVVDVMASPVALVVETFDVLIRRGAWRVIGSGPRVQTPILVFRVAVGGMDSQHLESYDCKKTRPALPAEVPLVPNRTAVSPKKVERMFLALHGLAEERPGDHVHTFTDVASRARLLE
jgi:hypothetical protein